MKICDYCFDEFDNLYKCGTCGHSLCFKCYYDTCNVCMDMIEEKIEHLEQVLRDMKDDE